METTKNDLRQWFARDTKFKIGGLYRCCVATIEEKLSENIDAEFEDGMILDCKYEPAGNKNIILKDGIWQMRNKKNDVKKT